MRIQRLRLKGFKRFDDLTIDLGEHPARIVALVGPNGCGKSSVFDAFEEKLKDVKGASQGSESQSFFSKFMFHSDPQLLSQQYNKSDAIQVTMEGQAQGVTKKTFHIRSAYRFTSKLDVKSISAQPDLLDDTRRPMSSIAIDSRLQENYERLLGLSYAEWEDGTKPGNAVRAELLGRINEVLTAVLDVRVSSIGNVIAGKGQLYFEKDDAKEFPYQNLSSGEKEVIDIIVDLIVRGPEFDDTIYCIDEPELHLNTAIQRKLLVAIEQLIPPHCQLWIATHSIGFLRALQDQLAGECAVLDFAEKNYFRDTHTMQPIATTRAHWQRIFETALDDLVGLIAPKRIVYCEGRAEPDAAGDEQGLDAFVYNEIFGMDDPTTLFVSSGGTNDVKKNGSLAIKVISKALLDVELLLLHDRDERTDAARTTWLNEAPHHRMLVRREIENYLLDFDVLTAFCASKGKPLSRTDYDAIVTEIVGQDLKAGQTISQLKAFCDERQKTNADFKKALAEHLRGTSVHGELRIAIFPEAPATAASTPTVASTQGVRSS
ncbi:MAG: AAA family ATPase [Gemmatimonadaceae bacterium]|nr:AAA family ATPase [Gemmatimonadaceae bacterium]